MTYTTEEADGISSRRKSKWDDYYKAKLAIYLVIIGIVGFDILIAVAYSVIASISFVCFELIFGGLIWVAVLTDKHGWGLEDIL